MEWKIICNDKSVYDTIKQHELLLMFWLYTKKNWVTYCYHVRKKERGAKESVQYTLLFERINYPQITSYK